MGISLLNLLVLKKIGTRHWSLFAISVISFQLVFTTATSLISSFIDVKHIHILLQQLKDEHWFC